jgi:hypothetical protein
MVGTVMVVVVEEKEGVVEGGEARGDMNKTASSK